MATAGKVAPTPKDKFVNGTAYDKLDVVEYNGTLYIAKKASAGVLPTDTEYWMLAVDLTGKLDTTGDTENNTVTFESSDEADPTAWKDVATLASKEKNLSLFKKISTMFSNVRYLYKILGSTDISALGSVTQAIATLNGNVGSMKGISSSAAITTQGQYALDAREKNASIDGTLANELSKVNSNLLSKPTKIIKFCTDQVQSFNLNNDIFGKPHDSKFVLLVSCRGHVSANEGGHSLYLISGMNTSSINTSYIGCSEIVKGYAAPKIEIDGLNIKVTSHNEDLCELSFIDLL